MSEFSAPSDSLTTTGTVPATPTSLAVARTVDATETSLTLTWTAPTDGDSYTGVEIAYGTVNANPPAGDDRIERSESQGTTFVHAGRASGTTYYYAIRAVHSALNIGPSLWSTPTVIQSTTGTTASPTTPSQITGTPNNNDTGQEISSVVVTWVPASDNATYYGLQRCSGADCTFGANDTFNILAASTAADGLAAGTITYTDYSVTDDQTANSIYRYKVIAGNTNGEASIISANVTVEPKVTPLIQPTVDASYCADPLGAVPTAALQVKWINGGDQVGIVSRDIERAQSGDFSVVHTISSGFTGTSWTDYTVVLGVSYRYRVVAKFGTTGENTGDFTSAEAATKIPVDPDCTGGGI